MSLGSVWMLGACGMGVGPLAVYLKGEGWEVSGWDDSTGSPMELQLADAEIPLLRDPWAAGRSPSLVGRSSAVKPGHPALALAEGKGARVLRRGELLAELAACRTPAVLVPLPGAADDHQTANAEHLAAAHAAVHLPEARLAELTDEVVRRLDDVAGLERMRSALAAADAANRWDELHRHVLTCAAEGRAAR